MHVLGDNYMELNYMGLEYNRFRYGATYHETA